MATSEEIAQFKYGQDASNGCHCDGADGRLGGNCKVDNLLRDEKLVTWVHVHSKSYYRALYPSAGDIAGTEDIRRYVMLTHDSKGIVQKHEKCGQS